MGRVCELTEPEHGLGDPELEQRPDQRGAGDQKGDGSARRGSSAGVGARDEILKFGVAEATVLAVL